MEYTYKKLLRWPGIYELILLTVICACVYSPTPGYTQHETGSFEFDGYTREYQVYLPQNFQSEMPLVIALHGIRFTAENFKTRVFLHETADTSGFIVVYPQGLGPEMNIPPVWNVGPNYIDSRRIFHKSDDVGFLSTLIDTIHANYNVDLSRVYCCGHSTGGEMSFRMVAECGHRFAAVASVSGSLFDEVYKWQMIRPMPVLQIHGTGYESWYPYYEGFEGIWPIPKLIDFWLNMLDCSQQTDTLFFPDVVIEDSSQAQRISWTDCAGENEFIHYKILNGGHAWPGSDMGAPAGENINMDFNANAEILNFFKRHHNPLAYIAFGRSMESSTGYIIPDGEKIYVTGKLTNLKDHNVAVFAMIRNSKGTFQDSIQLFDDGMHQDRQASDNIWAGSKRVIPGMEDKFEVRLHTHDKAAKTTHKLHMHEIKYFTTIGPVVLADSIYADSIYDSRFRNQFIQLNLQNLGKSSTAKNLTVHLATKDARITRVDDPAHVNNIAPGEKQTSALTGFNYAPGFGPDSTKNNPIHFTCNIYSNDYLLWSDQFEYVAGIKDANNWPVAFPLISPADGDTMSLNGSSMSFSWNSARDVDDDSLVYAITIFNHEIDTTLTGTTDTTVFFDGSELFFDETSYNWTVLISDGSANVSADTFKFYIQKGTNIFSEVYDNLPQVFSLEQNYPNPFNPQTTISWQLPVNGKVELIIYDLLGQKVATLVSQKQSAGKYSMEWDASAYSSGIYFYRLQVEGKFVQTRKLVILK